MATKPYPFEETLPSTIHGKIELPVPDRDIARVLDSASAIPSLFNVAVSASGSQTSCGEWVTLRGRQENIAKAKASFVNST